MKIYTKKGDYGFTTNLAGDPIKKSDRLMDLQGTIDEVNASLGHLISLLEAESKMSYVPVLRQVQQALFRMGVDITTGFQKQLVKAEDVLFLEENIDVWLNPLPKQTTFLYYAGSPAATYAQVVRTITRRCERLFVLVCQEETYPEDGKYLNRLADFFYALARSLNHESGVGDLPMKLS